MWFFWIPWIVFRIYFETDGLDININEQISWLYVNMIMITTCHIYNFFLPFIAYFAWLCLWPRYYLSRASHRPAYNCECRYEKLRHIICVIINQIILFIAVSFFSNLSHPNRSVTIVYITYKTLNHKYCGVVLSRTTLKHILQAKQIMGHDT